MAKLLRAFFCFLILVCMVAYIFQFHTFEKADVFGYLQRLDYDDLMEDAPVVNQGKIRGSGPALLSSSSEINQGDNNTKPMNILILYPDDWRHDSIGGVGPVVSTPFLNELATTGIRFTHNCVTTSICWISRASYFMGQWASRHKTMRLHTPVFYSSFNESSWPGILRRNGYYTGHLGKWQFRSENRTVENLFNFTDLNTGRHVWKEKGQDVHACDYSRRVAIEFLQKRPKDVPFAVTVAFYPPKAVGNSKEPGAQWTPKKESMSLYANDTIPMPNDTFSNMPKWFQEEERAARSRWEERFEGEERYQASMKNYYRLVTEVDEACRHIVAELKRQDILNETLVIFTTDNGLFHAEHGLAGKWYPYQESIRVPLIIWDPRMPKEKHNTLDDSFTLNVDLAPTILGAAGLKPSPDMQGRDISDLYLRRSKNDGGVGWRKEFFYEYLLKNARMPRATALVRKDYKYIHWTDRKYEQLFNLQEDPMEEKDLFGQNDMEERLIEMRKRHEELARLAE